MKSFRHRLPSLTGLLVFEASARHMNFSRAADELHVTQAAVSKQIRQLEEHLEAKLFEREGRRVRLTGRGQQLHAKVSAAFNYLAEAVEELCERVDTRPVTLAANTATSHYWLSEVLKDFRDRHPSFEARIRIVTSDRTADLFDDSVDIAVVYDSHYRANWSSRLLFEEEVFPVASPQYIATHPLAGNQPAALLNHVLLEYERLEPNWINWSTWFEALGVSSSRLKPTEYGNSYIVLVDAATRGHGVTLGTRYLLDNEIASGRLARLSEFSVRPGRAYHLMANRGQPFRPEAELLFSWLSGYCQGT